MTRRRVVFHPGVEDDLVAILDDYAALDPALPSRFEARLDAQIERIELYPESGAILFESFRRVPIKRFPFIAIYLVGEERIDVLALSDVRRDPAWIAASVSGRGDA